MAADHAGAHAGMSLQLRDLIVPGDGGRPILAIERLDLEPGASLGVRGASGAGKSTLLFALAGLAPGAKGRIAWEGRNLLATPPAARARFRRERIGIAFQDHLLFDELDARANASVVSLFGPAHSRAAVRAEAGERLGMLGVPEGRRAAKLSGGERQRVAIARALAHEPAILLADEPTASLHAEAAEGVIALLAGERGRTRIVASHDPRLLEAMDRVIDLRDGRVLAA